MSTNIGGGDATVILSTQYNLVIDDNDGDRVVLNMEETMDLLQFIQERMVYLGGGKNMFFTDDNGVIIMADDISIVDLNKHETDMLLKALTEKRPKFEMEKNEVNESME